MINCLKMIVIKIKIQSHQYSKQINGCPGLGMGVVRRSQVKDPDLILIYRKLHVR